MLLSFPVLAGCYPLINDIATDAERPPRYLVAPPDDPAYDPAALREPTERAYPDLRNLTLPLAPPAVFAAVEALVAERGWEVAARGEGGPASGGEPWRLQAVAVTLVLRFRDDVLIEVRPDAATGGTGSTGSTGGTGSIVAMRSKSRLGKGDFGANAKRIRAFLADLRERLGQ